MVYEQLCANGGAVDDVVNGHPGLLERVDALELEVKALREEVSNLKAAKSCKKTRRKREKSEEELQHERDKELARDMARKYVEHKKSLGEADFVGKSTREIATDVFFFAIGLGVELNRENIGIRGVITRTVCIECGIGAKDGYYRSRTEKPYGDVEE